MNGMPEAGGCVTDGAGRSEYLVSYETFFRTRLSEDDFFFVCCIRECSESLHGTD